MRSSDNTIEFNEGWVIIQTGILKLTQTLKADLKNEFPVLDYINIYTIVYKMCTQYPPHMYAQQLYDKYRDSFEEYITLTVSPALEKVHDEYMLRELVKCWGNHKVMVRFMSNMFSYLDLHFVGRESLDSLTKVGMMYFRDIVYHSIKTKVKNVLIQLINQEREGEQIDRALLRNVLNIFVEMGMDHSLNFYEGDFEAAMLEDNGDYYSRKAALWILEDSCPNYMLKAEERVAHYLHSTTEQKLLEKVQNEILSHYQTQLLENEYSGCHALLMGDKKDDLSRMYKLFRRVPKGLEPVANIFKQHVTSKGLLIFKWVKDAVNNNADRSDIDAAIQEHGHGFGEKIIELHDKCMNYVVDEFQGSSTFSKVLQEAFEVICDQRIEESTTAELLATFLDSVLKKSGIVKTSGHDIESVLGKAVNLLRYVSDRDLFVEFHSKKLARRLLFDESANDTAHERTILSKLKHQFGFQITSKMERMVNDVTVSIETQADFKAYIDNYSNMHPGIELAVTVLSTGFWPTYKSSEINLPSEMLKCIDLYKGFYSTKYQHRKLSWIDSLGICKIIGKFDSKPIEITVSTNQAVLLLLFNDSERLTY